MSKARYQHQHGTKSAYNANKSNILPDEIVIVDSGISDNISHSGVFYKALGNNEPIQLLNKEDSIDLFIGTNDKTATETISTDTYKVKDIYFNRLDNKAWICIARTANIDSTYTYTWVALAADLSNYVTTAELNSALADKVDKTTTIAGIDLQDSITVGELKTALGVGTTIINSTTSSGWSGTIPNTYAGQTGEVGEVALYEDYGTLWYLADNSGGTYEWYPLVTEDEIATKENTSNKVTNLSANSTNTQYPSAKCVYALTETEMAGALVAAGLRLQSATDQQGTFFFITARPQNQMLVRGVMENATISDVHTNLLTNIASQYGELTASVLRLFYSDPSWGWDDLLLALAKIEAASPAEWYRAAAKAIVANDFGMTWQEPSYFTGQLAFLASRTENIGNKVTSLSAQSNDDQYPSAKCVYDMIGNVETLLSQV